MENRILPEAARELGKALVGSTTLYELSLPSNNMGDIGAVEMGKLLGSNRSITACDLGRCGFTSSGIESLALGLEGNSVILNLCLQGNQAGDEGAVALAKHALAPNACSVAVLHLGDNGIGERGGEALAAAFPGNTSITNMDLDGNDSVAQADKDAIFNATSSNKFGW